MEKKSAVVVVGRRKKLWELEGFHCSLLGTCFSRAELRKVAKRKEISLVGGLADYHIHNRLVHLAALKGPEAKVLHRLLEKKYHRAVVRFAKVRTVEGLRQLWRLHLDKGAVAGAYWALLTHPAVSQELSAEAHGEIHMIGHDFIGDYQRERLTLSEMRTRLKASEEKLSTEKQKVRELRHSVQEREQETAELLSSNDAMRLERDDLRRRLLKKEGSPVADETAAPKDLRERMARLELENKRLHDMLDELREGAKRTELTMHELKETNMRLLQEKEDVAQEVVSLEKTLQDKLASACGCAACGERQSSNCPGPGLCGKIVLYVGGLHRMVPHYRELVEKYGGVFVHHDGGREVSTAVLPKMLCQADAVLCPVDCVSHDACLSVKKICKRQRKPFVMMRSSGLSSLAKGLSDIMRSQAA